MIHHLENGWEVDQAILSEEDKVVVIRFGHDYDPQCMQMGTVINSKVTDLYTFVVWMIAPFNIIKATLMTVVTLPLFKKMEKILTK